MTQNNQEKQAGGLDAGFGQKVIEIRRVTRVMAGGKRMRFSACVLVGDQKGQVGMGLAKDLDVTKAISKAVTLAKKKLVKIPIYKDTIPCFIEHKFKAAKILLKPAPKGSGIIAGGSLRMVLELAGVKNVVGKILGSNNKLNNIVASLQALKKLNRRVKIKS